ARWDFGAEEATPLTAHGDVQRDQAGPRPPEFPDFAENNTAVHLDGKGARLVFEDPGPESRFDFGDADAITLEAWVRVEEIREGQPMYVIGKGRTNSPRFARDNQNWALRVVGAGDQARLSFLFATKPGAGSSHWHRWTSRLGFQPATGWHHIAVAYRFGTPQSVAGWIDGQRTDGTWDMGGATAEAPVVDDDAIWIGSSMGGNVGNSFHGWIDAVAVYRAALDDKAMASRYHRIGGPRVVGPQPEVMPEIAEIPDGRVLVTLHEGMPDHQRWLNEGEAWPPETARWIGDEFLLPRIPLRFDDWGLRESWKAPVLLRMAADIELPPGKHQVLLRGRALGRLWVDGQVVARTEAQTKQPPNGEESITPWAQPPRPGLRIAGYRQQEVSGEIEIPAGKPAGRSRVVLELLVGGKDRRTETGEVCVAIETADGDSFMVLRPQAEPVLSLTDAAIEPALARIERSLSALDDVTRRQAAASQDEFWSHRHAIARAWAAEHPAPTVPALNAPGAVHPVDAFLQSKIERARAASSGADAQAAAKFHGEVLPILRENCFRCHGEKDKGGLKLNSREAALKGGDSEVPAVVPRDPDASELLTRLRSNDESMRMPPKGDGLSREQIDVLERWIREGAAWPAPPLNPESVALAAPVNDAAFLRRLSLDLIGRPLDPDETVAFLSDQTADKRSRIIERLLDDRHSADQWMSFWQDLLAENPTLLNLSLNSTGPFRWFLYDALRDQKALDRMVTELLMMRGSAFEGGSDGFKLAAENDAPYAAKAHIAASAFLGIELQCARCHDSPYHSTTQRDLYALSAMLSRQIAIVPKTSRVPAAFFENKARESLIRVTLNPDEQVQGAWPFAEVTGVADGPDIDRLVRQREDQRERLCALITAPTNRRFARVMVNRVWKQFMGAGLVEPVHDWEGRTASHPELLDWLAQELIAHDYDLRHVIRLIVTSQAYQREAAGRNLAAAPELRFFNAPERRRLTAEQIVDSLHAVTGCAMDVEELTFVHDGRRPVSNRLTLGKPSRAWMFASLNNERDRPSLSLPRARAVADVLEAFGWTGSRQKPLHQRETDPNVLQPGVRANGTLTMTLTRASAGSELADLAVRAQSVETLVDVLFVRVLGRRPTADEQQSFGGMLSQGFAERMVPPGEIPPCEPQPRLPLVTWFNHLSPEANTIQQELEQRVRRGPPADPRLQPQWREAFEDAVWSLINHREFVWIP
ncbi:MAG TPA: DUF1553 domain-containing protein, partial [Planctomycetaceae bacterium]|nr:DUF1553 domain-containing protein [Planctomycetaceae bacterium]